MHVEIVEVLVSTLVAGVMVVLAALAAIIMIINACLSGLIKATIALAGWVHALTKKAESLPATEATQPSQALSTANDGTQQQESVQLTLAEEHHATTQAA